jgi:hypothetical protein
MRTTVRTVARDAYRHDLEARPQLMAG